MARLEVRLLGGFEVVLDGRVVTEFESVAERALLARLAAEPGTEIPRAALAELLWPGRASGTARGNLRHALASLRRNIGDHGRERPALDATRSDVTFDPAADVVVDVAEFRRLAATPATALGATPAWRDAVALRRGEFLAGFDAPLSGEWDTWVVTMRRSLDEQAADTLARLADRCERRGDHERGIDLARRRIEIDPWDEPAHRQLIRLLALDGRRAAALDHAESFEAALRAELGVEPAPETHELVERIRNGGFQAPAGSMPGLPARPFAAAAVDEVCVGRAGHLAWLDEHLERALAGSGGVVFVTGSAGAGKSVLVRTFADDAIDRHPNLTVLGGACNAVTGTGDPFLPFRQIAGLLCGDLDRAWVRGSLTESQAARLWNELPDVVETVLDHGPALLGTLIDAASLLRRFDERFADHPLGPRLRAAVAAAHRRIDDPTRRRLPLLDQYVTVVSRLAMRHPLLLVVDDLHWADAGTLELLLHLARHVADAPVLVVAALRPGEEAAGPDSITRVVDEVRALSSADSLIEITGDREFVDAWLDIEPNALAESFRAQLFRVSHGHALFTVEMVRALRDRGELLPDETGRWVVGPPIEWTEIPPRVEATIAARLAGLPDEEHRDLEAAAVQGPVFTPDVVTAVRDDSTDVEQRLARLAAPPQMLIESAGSSVVGGRRIGRYRFRHGLFQRYLYDHLALPERRRLHEHTGRAIAELHADRIEDVAVDLAMHFDRAELVEEAIEYHGLVGRRAMRLSADTGAIDHFERAIELLDTLDPTPERELRAVALLTSLGACLQSHAGYNSAATTMVYERLRELIPRMGPTVETAAALGALATVDGLRARYADALAGVEQLLVTARRLEATPIETVAHMHAGWLLLMTDRLAEADERLTQAIDGYDAAWDEWLISLVGLHVPSTALAWRSIVCWHLGRPDDARRLSAESLEAARRAGYPFGLTFALSVAGCLLSEFLEMPDVVLAAADEAAAISEREDIAFYRAAARLHHGSALAMKGDVETGLPEMYAGLAGWSELGTVAFTTWIRTWLAEMLVRHGRLDEAAEVLDEVDVRLSEGEERIAAHRARCVRGLLHRARGDDQAAERVLRSAIDLADGSGARGPQLQAAVALGELLCDLGRCTEARDVLNPLVDGFADAEDPQHLQMARILLDRCAR